MSKFSTLTEMLERTISEILKSVGTSIPGHILSFSEDTQLAKVQIGIEFIDINGNTFDLAPIVNIPVYFLGGNNFHIEHQIDEGDEGLIIISQRCIDGWKEQGGVAAQTVLRKLDMQDALFLPGFRSKPNAISGFSNNGVRIRNKAGTHYIWLKNTGDILSENENGSNLLSADGGSKLTTPLSVFEAAADGSIEGINGSGSFELQSGGTIDLNGVTIDPSGNIITPTTMTAATLIAPSVLANGKDVADHAHAQGVDSDGDTQQNTGNNL